MNYETSLVGQWFRLHASPAGVTVQSLVWELRTHKPCSAANSNDTPTKKNTGILETKSRPAPLQLGDLVGMGVGVWGSCVSSMIFSFPMWKMG